VDHYKGSFKVALPMRLEFLFEVSDQFIYRPHGFTRATQLTELSNAVKILSC